MEIKTKFKIGDVVWVSITKWNILKAKIEGIYYSGHLKYHCNYFDGGIGFVPEEELFATQAEAQKECERRNGTIS